MSDIKEKIKIDTKKLTNELVESFAKFLVENGIDRETSEVVAKQAVYGSAVMMKNSNEHPCELVDRVCSPGGTTLEAIRVLEQHGLRSSVFEAVKACAAHCKKVVDK